jgi:hypothetical protein
MFYACFTVRDWQVAEEAPVSLKEQQSLELLHGRLTMELTGAAIDARKCRRLGAASG